METIQVEQNGDVFSCDISISKEEWLDILKDDKTPQAYKETLLRFYYMPGHRGSCVAVSKKMGSNAHALNLYVSKFGQYVKKRLNRFEVYGTDGKPTRWVIPMCKGRNLSIMEEGAFEWELRPELVEALREYLYWYLVENYKNLRKELPIRDETKDWDELYKWELITASIGKTPIKIVSDNVTYPSKATKGGFENLIDAARDNKTLKYLVENKRTEFETVLENLSDNSQSLNKRLADFKTSMGGLLPPTGYNSKANDERTAATILTCINPDKYTFYKHDVMYDRFCKYLGEDMQKAGACYEHYLTLLAPLAKMADADAELQQIIMTMLEGQRQSKLLLAQDILWMLLRGIPKRLGYIFDLLFNPEKQEEMNSEKKYIKLLEANKNLILTGAPGTGKTYLARAIAEEMGAEVGFVQFHPSYDYTDFVEGLRPTKEKQNSTIGFYRQDGIFKEFCKKAILSETVDKEIMGDINSNPTVWKVSLEGTGDNPTRKDCLENGYIRIGWHQYGDIDDFYDYDNYYEGGKNPLRAFQSGMKIGDLVVSCYSAKEIDAVGVVTGEYEYRSEGGEYPRYRSVRWLVKNIRENIVEQNKGKTFTLPTVYKASITAEAVLKIVQKYSKTTKEAVRKDKTVFVIDEINRGEISKIFGELFFSIDPSYRGEKGKVNTQYQNMIEEGDVFKDGFYVPENVYIIGTMNDIDRSVESMDFAMRRRFAWQEVTAEESYTNMIENDEEFVEVKDEIKQRMFSLNKAIAETEGLDEAYQIGAAYFRKYLDYQDKENPFECLWNNHLKGLLYEYLRGNRRAKEQLEKLHKAYNKTNVDEQPAHTNEG